MWLRVSLRSFLYSIYSSHPFSKRTPCSLSLSLSLFLSRAMLMVHVHLMVLYLIVQDYQAPKFQAPIEILSIALPYFCRNENEWVWVCMPGIFIHMWISKTACVCIRFIRYLIATYDGNVLNWYLSKHNLRRNKEDNLLSLFSSCSCCRCCWC